MSIGSMKHDADFGSGGGSLEMSGVERITASAAINISEWFRSNSAGVLTRNVPFRSTTGTRLDAAVSIAF